MTPLDPINIELDGYTLVEASAGTGKTYTITSLYLRFIMEKGLHVRDILVVTYTRAATEELRFKIRQRLQAGLGLLKGRAAGHDDRFIHDLAEALENSGGPDRQTIIHRLEEAMLCLDEAAVFTIHSFCQRMLREFAFESSAPLNTDVLTSEEEILKAGCAEYVRSNFYLSDKRFMEWTGSVFSVDNLPTRIYTMLRSVVNLPLPRIIHRQPLEEVVKEGDLFCHKVKKIAENMGEMGAELGKKISGIGKAAINDLMAFLSAEAGLPEKTAQELKKGIEKEFKGLLKKETLVLTGLSNSGDMIPFELPDLVLYNPCHLASWHFMRVVMDNLLPASNKRKSRKLKELLEPLGRAFHAAVNRWFNLKEQAGPPPEGVRELLEEPVMEQLADILLVHAGINKRLKTAILCDARDFARQYAAEWKKRRSAITYDDMLLMLRDALVDKHRGNPLAGRMERRFPVALIDEFQDTDSIQWEIFRTIYSNPEKSALFLIGDPKQAIYGFRGADIFTYLEAGALVPEHRRFSLDTNWRSSPALVNAVNTIFRHRGKRTFVLEGIDFMPVRARDDFEEILIIEDEDSYKALEIWLFFKEEKKDNERETLGKGPEDSGKDKMQGPCAGPAELTALEIKRLITLGEMGKAFFQTEEMGRRPVTPGDLAVLVRNFIEAGRIRDALYGLGIPSIYYGPGSVFKSDDARDMLCMLNAVSNPSDVTAVCTALGTVPLGVNAQDIHRLRHASNAWEEMMEKFSELKAIWLRKGVFPMLRALFQWFNVPARLLALEDGERRLTNLRQISELLAHAEKEHPGMERLILWLHENIHNPDEQADEQKLRLETDENLVKVMSCHRSKGLEFPVLFLPFVDMTGVDEREDLIPRIYHPGQGCYICPVSEKMPGRQEAETELMELKRRLTYGPEKMRAGDKKDKQRLDQQHEIERQKRAELVRLVYVALTRGKHKVYFGFSSKASLCGSTLGNMLLGHIDQKTLQLESSVPLLMQEFAGQDGVAVLSHAEKLSCMDGLHSARTQQTDSTAKMPPEIHRRPIAPKIWMQTSFSSLMRETSAGIPSVWTLEELDRKESMDIFSFPKGPVAGNCVHKLFETIEFRGEEEDFLQPARKVLEEFNLEEKWDMVLARTAVSVLETEIGKGIRLARLDPDWISKEMGFVWPFSQGEMQHFPVLREHCRKGVVKGFIDLVFRHEDAFYILDYKTNWLGHRLEDYSQASLERAMDEHDYWLQAGIYARALDRLLRAGLEDYRFDQHMGGVFYLFIRGISRAHGADYGVRFIERERLIERYPRFFTGEPG